MEWIIYIFVVLLIIAAVWAWHANADKISFWVKGGPIPRFSKGGVVPQRVEGNFGAGGPTGPTLSQRVDLMHQFRDKCLEQAAALEVDIAAARADVDAATKKLLPPQT